MDTATFRLNYQAAAEKFAEIPGYKDADEKIQFCQKQVEEIKAQEEEQRLLLVRKEKLKKRIIGIMAAVLVVCIAVGIALSQVLPPLIKYNQAIRFIEEGRYSEAYSVFYQLDGYKDSTEQLKNFLSVPSKIESVHFQGYRNTAEYIYDENGNVLKYIWTASEHGGSEGSAEYTYDTNGRVIKAISGGDFTGACTSDYSYNGNVVKEIETYEDGDKSITEHTYNENGYRTLWASEIGDNEIYDRRSEYAYDDKGNVVEIRITAPYGGGSTNKYTYDENGNVKKIISEDDYNQRWIAEYIYDENENIIEKKTECSNETQNMTTQYSDYQVFYRPGKNNKIIPGVEQIDFLAFPQY